jgi:hypothetical protein
MIRGAGSEHEPKPVLLGMGRRYLSAVEEHPNQVFCFVVLR